MEIKVIKENNVEVALVDGGGEVLVTDAQSALDLLATVRYETDCDRMILYKSAVCEDFFRLRTGLAGEVLQKFINYRMKLAIVGDFSGYESKSLRDFIYESNSGRDIFFLPDHKQAAERLAGV